MRYAMKQKLFSFGEDFRIQDAGGTDKFFVDGKAFSWGDKLSFQDMQGNELAFIRQKLLSWGPKYEIYRDGEVAATVKKDHFTLFRCSFAVDVPGPDDLEAQGDFLEMEYTFRRGRRAIAEVSKRWFALTDSYGVDIAEGEDEVLILASTVVIDMVCHGEKHKHS
jgi:uncharacterized protein YxjI